jgi:hypothetical protein
MTGSQKFDRQQRAVRGSQNQDIESWGGHAESVPGWGQVFGQERRI